MWEWERKYDRGKKIERKKMGRERERKKIWKREKENMRVRENMSDQIWAR